MTDESWQRRRAIYMACDKVGTPPPAVRTYANGITVAFANGDNDRVIVLIGLKDSYETILHKIKEAFAVKPENLASDEALERLKS